MKYETRPSNQEKKVVYLQIDEAPTGSTVELIGMAKANDWKVMIEQIRNEHRIIT